MRDEIVYSFVVRDVSVTMDENTIKNELMNRYNGVTNVSRMFFDDEEATPKTSVQVDFTTYDDAENIFQEQNIVIGGICRRVYAIKKPRYQRTFYKQRQNPPQTTKTLSEEDLIHIFNQQKKYLEEVMNSLDDKLSNAITPQQNNHQITKPMLANNVQ